MWRVCSVHESSKGLSWAEGSLGKRLFKSNNIYLDSGVSSILDSVIMCHIKINEMKIVVTVSRITSVCLGAFLSRHCLADK